MNKYIYFIFLLIISFALYIFEKSFMFSNEVNGSNGSLVTYSIILMLLFSTITVILHKKNILMNKLSKKLTILMIFIYMISLCYAVIYPFGSRYTYGSIILPLFVFYFTSIYSYYFKDDNIITWIMTFLAIMLSYYFINNYYNNMMYNAEMQNNGSYAILYLTPFMLCHKNKAVKISSIIMVAIVVMLSLKRGGFFALMGGILIYLYISQFKIKEQKFKIISVFIVLIVGIILTYLITYMNNTILSGLLFERMEETTADGGSGRIDIYKYFIGRISDSSILNLIFGRGYLGSTRTGGMSLTCHNDILEMIIDYGIIGLILYLSFVISLIKLCKKMIRNKHKYAPAMGASIVIFLINSMVSHIIIYPWYLIEFSFFWGFIAQSSNKNISRNYNI